MQRAFIFDLNGTIIDDMEYHARAWYNIIVNELGAQLTPAAVKQQLYGKNEELLVRIFGEGYFTPEQMHALSMKKEKRYQEEFLPHRKLIKGLGAFFEKAYELQIPMGLGTAAIMFNVNYILQGLQLQKYFTAIVSADDVVLSKPHPETFLQCAQLLNIAKEQCIVFEDTPKGVETAKNAGMKAVVIKTYHKENEFGYLDNIIAFVNDYTDPVLQKLLQ
ncbi:MAG: HAD family phosphatase [Sphingobacteriia bacterium]|nr:HAD family phosphatase [Sphingobacteriia bacterium]